MKLPNVNANAARANGCRKEISKRLSPKYSTDNLPAIKKATKAKGTLQKPSQNCNL